MAANTSSDFIPIGEQIEGTAIAVAASEFVAEEGGFDGVLIVEPCGSRLDDCLVWRPYGIVLLGFHSSSVYGWTSRYGYGA